MITRTASGLQFADAVSVTVNGKDKVESLGAKPEATVPLNKLQSVKLDGTLLKSADSHVVALYSEGVATYIIPQPQKNGPTEPAAMWSAAKITYKKAPNDKTPTEVSADDFVAFLPGGAEQLTEVCQDQAALQLLGGNGKTFDTQLTWILAVVKAYASNPAMAPLARFVAQSMRRRYEQFESGVAGVDVLDQGIRFGQLSAAAYPNDAEQAQLRKALIDKRAWVDRKLAVITAFSAVQDWDALVLAVRDFEAYQQAFPDISAKYAAALKESLKQHKQAGDERTKEHEYGAALREFRMASMRQPSDTMLAQNMLMSWTDYSRQLAIQRQGQRKQLSAGERAAIDQDLLFATRFKEQNKLPDALAKVTEAEQIDPRSLPVLLKKAEVLGAQREISRALAALDAYDVLAIDEERQKSSTLRSELMFLLVSSSKDAADQFDKAWAGLSFHKALDIAVQGLKAKDNDASLLFDAGMAAMVTRNVDAGRGYFARYLDVSNTLDADAAQRIRVRQLMATPRPPAAAAGERNWMSGLRLPKDVFYCPASLAFQPQIERIDASNKLKVAYDWDGGKLKSITPMFDKDVHITPERKVTFGYEDQISQVVSVGYDLEARVSLSPDPDERFRSSILTLSNNPYADPTAIFRLTGKNVTQGIAGNRYFEPFVWDKVHYFQFTYDAAGRVTSARELAGPRGTPLNQWLEFEWDGLQLVSITGFEGADEKHRGQTYSRTMQYQDGHLTSEEIRSQGRTSRIKYVYNGGRLVTASCDKDATLDDRSRQVTFR